MAKKAPSDDKSRVYHLLSKGDPDKVILVQVFERNGGTFGDFGASALRPGGMLGPPIAESGRPVPDVLEDAEEWAAQFKFPIRIVIVGSAQWNTDWGILEGKGDHPSLKPLTTIEIIENGRQVILDHVGGVIVGFENYRNAFGLTIVLPNGNYSALIVSAGPDDSTPGWLRAQDFVVSQFTPPNVNDPSVIWLTAAGDDES